MTRVIQAREHACSEGGSKVVLKSVFSREPALALAALLTVGSLPSATDASAHYGHRGGYHHDSGFRHGGYWRGGYRPYAHYYYYHRGFYPRYSYYGRRCYRWRWVATPWGWRMHRVNACYPYYRSYYNYY
jgi:hypothetical protein